MLGRLWAWLRAPFHPTAHVPSKEPEINLIASQQKEIQARLDLLNTEAAVQLRERPPAP